MFGGPKSQATPPQQSLADMELTRQHLMQVHAEKRAELLRQLIPSMTTIEPRLKLARLRLVRAAPCIAPEGCAA